MTKPNPRAAALLAAELREPWTMPLAEERRIKLEIEALTCPERIRAFEAALDADWERVHWVRETSDAHDLAYLLAAHGGLRGAMAEARRITRALDDSDRL